jgi:hypothetical protein
VLATRVADRLAADFAQLDGAARLLASAETVLVGAGYALAAVAQAELAADMVRLQAQMGAEVLGSAWKEGQALTLEQAIDYALEE